MMAEMYVYKGPHWMDAPSEEQPELLLTGYQMVQLRISIDKILTDEQKTKKLALLEIKYNARYRPGDVVQVMEDGVMWDSEKNDWGFENHNPMLMFVKLDGISCEDARTKYMPPYMVVSSYEVTRKVTRELYDKDSRLGNFFADEPIIIREFSEYDEVDDQDIPMVELRGHVWHMAARRKIRLKIETASPQELSDMENMRVVLSSIAEEDKSKL